MRRHQTLIFLCCITLVSTGALAQEIGQQGTDIFTGQPATPVAPVSLPDTSGRNSRTADEGRKLVFKSQTVLIQVPAVVTDKSGNHIRNLTKEDFKILENGKVQRIAISEEITPGNAPPPRATSPGTFSNLTVDVKQPVSVTVIALDMINTPFLDQSYGRQQLIKYLGNTLDSGHGFGLVVISSKGLQVLGGLDSDPASLIAALKKAGGEQSAMETFGTEGRVLAATDPQPSELNGGGSAGADATSRMRRFILNSDALESSYQQSRAIEDTMKAFLEIAWSLSGVPGRKSLIWATGSFPFVLDSPSSVPGGNLSVLYERTMEALNNAQISVYPVDVRGLVNTSPAGDPKYSGATAQEFGYVAAGRSWLHSSSVDSLKDFAQMTGGRAYFNNNDLAAGFTRAADDSSSYYMLSYYGDTHNTKPGWRTLQVQVARKDVEVCARTGFLVTTAINDPQLTHQADVGLALSSPFDSTGIQMTVKWQGLAPDGDKRKVGFALHLPTTGVIDEADQNRFDLDFIAQATKSGAPVGNAGQTMKGTIPPASLAKIKAEGILYQNALDLPAGDYLVRFVVRDNLRGRIGSVSAPLTVR